MFLIIDFNLVKDQSDNNKDKLRVMCLLELYIFIYFFSVSVLWNNYVGSGIPQKIPNSVGLQASTTTMQISLQST